MKVGTMVVVNTWYWFCQLGVFSQSLSFFHISHHPIPYLIDHEQQLTCSTLHIVVIRICPTMYMYHNMGPLKSKLSYKYKVLYFHWFINSCAQNVLHFGQLVFLFQFFQKLLKGPKTRWCMRRTISHYTVLHLASQHQLSDGSRMDSLWEMAHIIMELQPRVELMCISVRQTME